LAPCSVTFYPRMAIKMSPQKFKAAYGGALLNLHWRQWQSLGLSGRVPGGWNATTDLEALIISTLAIGLSDRRLMLAAMEWLVTNDRLVNISRLKKIGRNFGQTTGGQAPVCFHPDTLALVSDLLKRSGKRGFIVRAAEGGAEQLKGCREALEAFRIRNLVSLPQLLAGPAHLQLAARSFFGNDARADVLAYLMLNQNGNPFLLAREVHSDYKNVYLIIDDWRRAGVVERRAGGDALVEKNRWFELFQVPPDAAYINWAPTLGALCQLEAALGSKPWADDQYLLSSLFRDLHPLLSPAVLAAGERLPEPARHKGGEYFEPFAGALLAALAKLGKQQ